MAFLFFLACIFRLTVEFLYVIIFIEVKIMKIEKIESIKKRYHREWLLIALNKIDESTTTPISGRLISHSPHREDIYRLLLKPPKGKKLLVEYSEDTFPKGYAAAF